MTELLLAPNEIGVYADIPDHVYHADKTSLSSSGARALLPPSCPAIFRHSQDNPRESTKAFDQGHAAHTLVLGVGAEIVEITADNWTTKAAKEARDAVYAEGKTPLLTKDYGQVHAMAAAVRNHPVAAALLAQGTPELSMYWHDAATGARLRIRPDWLPNSGGGRLIIVDYKTSTSANPDKFAKSAADFGYAQQAAFYIDGIIALGIDENPAFVFIVQDKNAPYLVSVVELERDAIEVGRQLNRRSIDLFARCMESGIWPAYGEDVHLVRMPSWWMRQHDDALPW